eukprot:INCI18395.2.p1 GENE.INCI18395.2~~INCI18395.2.p1  ORF type:complete len:1259 (+),score=189.65 INCI18395.2:265-3777(+)
MSASGLNDALVALFGSDNGGNFSDSGVATGLPFELERARTQYSLSAILSNSVLYFGVAGGMLLALCVATRWPKIAACFVPRWLNKSLPTAWATGWPSPTRTQVVDVLMSSDFSSEAEGGRVGQFDESSAETAQRNAPSCRRCLWCRFCHESVGHEDRRGFLAWMWVPWCISDAEIVARTGLDGFLVFRVMKLLLIMTLILFGVSMVLMLPTYVTLAHPCPAAVGSEAASHGQNAWIWGDTMECNVSYVFPGNISCTCGFFDTLSMNVGAGYYVHEVVATMISLLMVLVQFSLVGREFRFWMRVRLAYTETAPPEIYTVLVRYIPEHLRSEVRLRKMFEELYPGAVHAVHVVPDKRTGVSAHVQRVDDVQMSITRQHTVNETYRKVEETTHIPCCRIRSPITSMVSLQRKEKKALEDLKESRDVFVASCAMHIRRDLRELGTGRGRLNTEAFHWADRKKRERRKQRYQARHSEENARAVTFLKATEGEQAEAKDGTVPDGAVAVEVHPPGGHGTDSDSEDDAGLEQDPLKLYSNHAFVTFNTATAALSCVANAKTICSRRTTVTDAGNDSLSASTGAMQIVAARQPRDVRWADLQQHKAKGEWAVNLFVILMFVLILVVWGFIVVVIGAYTTADQLGCEVFQNCTSTQAKSPFWTTVFAFISPLFLQALSAVLKVLIGNLVGMKFVPFRSQVDQQLFVLFWVFQATQNFIIYSIAASLLLDLGQYIMEPIRFFQELGWSIPEGATFYIVFIETEILFTLLFGMFRTDWFTGAAAMFGLSGQIPFRRMVYNPSLCSSFGAPSTPSTFSPASPLIRVLFIFLLVNSYAVVQPFITVIGVIYAVMSLSLYTHDMLAVSTTRQDSGGLYWRDVYGVLVACIIIPQFVILCVVVASNVPWLIAVQVVVIAASSAAAIAIYWPYRANISTFSEAVAARIDAATEAKTRLPSFRSAHQKQLALSGFAVSDETTASGTSSSTNSIGRSDDDDDADRTGLARDLSEGLIEGAEWLDKAPDAQPRVDWRDSDGHMRPGSRHSKTSSAATGMTVIIPPNVWRNAVLLPNGDCFGDRGFLKAATAQDMAYANRHLVESIQARMKAVAGTSEEAATKAKIRAELRAATFVYDYQHPALRSARNLTSRFTVSARQREREAAAALLIQTVVKARLARRLKRNAPAN